MSLIFYCEYKDQKWRRWTSEQENATVNIAFSALRNAALIAVHNIF